MAPETPEPATQVKEWGAACVPGLPDPPRNSMRSHETQDFGAPGRQGGIGSTREKKKQVENLWKTPHFLFPVLHMSSVWVDLATLIFVCAGFWETVRYSTWMAIFETKWCQDLVSSGELCQVDFLQTLLSGQIYASCCVQSLLWFSLLDSGEVSLDSCQNHARIEGRS